MGFAKRTRKLKRRLLARRRPSAKLQGPTWSPLKTVGSFALFVTSLPVFANIFDYDVKQIPRTAGLDCDGAAVEVGARFQAITSIAPLSSTCTGRHNSRYGVFYDALVRYRADFPLPLVSTGAAGRFTLFNPAGYEDVATCEAALSEESDRFRRATNLEPVVAFCHPMRYARRRYPITMRIDGFGNALTKPQFSGARVWGAVQDHTAETFTTAVAANLQQRGIQEVSFVKLESSSGYLELATMYYAEEQLRLWDAEITRVQTLEHCEEALERANTAFAAFGAAPLINYCTRIGISGTYDLGTVLADESFALEDSAERLTSFTDCEANRSRIENLYRIDLGMPLIESFCSLHFRRDGSRGGWKVRFIVENI